MTKSYEAEAAEADEREYLASALPPADVDVELDPGPKSAIAIRLDAADVERLKARADAEGMGFTQLARQWILERLEEDSTVPADAEAALATLRRYVSNVRVVRLSAHPPTEPAASERATKAVDLHGQQGKSTGPPRA